MSAGALTTKLRQVHDGRPGAEGELYVLCEGRMLRQAHAKAGRLGLSAGQGDDVAQSAFVELLVYIRRHPDRILDSNEFWRMYGHLTKCKVCKIVRRPRPSPADFETLADHQAEVGSDFELQDLIAAHRASLSDEQRLTLDLRVEQGLQIEAIADHFGCSERTVRRRLERVMDKLLHLCHAE